MTSGTLQYKPLHESLTIKPSPTQGLGVFACKAIPKETDLGITHLQCKDLAYHFPQNVVRTPLGGFLNHSEEPNMIRKQIRIEPYWDKWTVTTTKDIKKDEEITLKYTMYRVDNAD